MRLRKLLISYPIACCLGLTLLASCAQRDDMEGITDSETQQLETSKRDYQQHTVSFSTALDPESAEELRLLSGVYARRDSDPNEIHTLYPVFRIYNTVEDFRKMHSQTLPSAVAREFGGNTNRDAITQTDLDNAPYASGSTAIGGNMHDVSIVVYNEALGAGSVAITSVRMRAVRRNGKDYMTYSGTINFPKGIQLTNKEHADKWYCMLFTGARGQGEPPANGLNADEPNKEEILWRIYQGVGPGGKTFSGQTIDESSGQVTIANHYTQAEGNQTPTLVGVPLATNWSKLNVNPEDQNATNKQEQNNLNTDMTLRVQGALLQYDIFADVYDQIDMRRFGLVSNSIDLVGSYMLTANNVAEAFKNKDTQGVGVPGWRPERPNYTTDANSPAAFFMYKRNQNDPARIDNGVYPFPWDLPALHTPYLGQRQAPGLVQVSNVSMSDALYAYRAYVPRQNTSSWNTSRLLNANGEQATQIGTPYMGTPLSGRGNGALADRQNFQRLIFWGMPRKERPTQPATYLFADIHSARIPYYTATTAGVVDVLKQDNYATQKSMVLHQTNANFRPGRISHINTSIEADLMITEVSYDSSESYKGVSYPGGFTALEIINASYSPKNLDDYALVRLVPKSNGSTTTYEYYVSEGVSSKDIKQASILPLSIVADPNGTKTFLPGGKTFDADPSKYNKNYISYGVKYGWETDVPLSKTILHQEALVLLSKNIFNLISREFDSPDLLNQVHPFLIRGDYSSSIPYRVKYGNQVYDKHTRVSRIPLAPSDAEGGYAQFQDNYSDPMKSISYNGSILDLEKNDQPAFALIRFYREHNSYRIIDATAPLPNSVGYSEGVSEPYPLVNSSSPYLKAMNSIVGKSYTIERKPGINFPSIFPFRTDKQFDELWSYEETAFELDKASTTLFYRSKAEKLLDLPGKSTGYGINNYFYISDAYVVSNYGRFVSNYYYPNHRNPIFYDWWSKTYSKNIPAQSRY